MFEYGGKYFHLDQILINKASNATKVHLAPLAQPKAGGWKLATRIAGPGRADGKQAQAVIRA